MRGLPHAERSRLDDSGGHGAPQVRPLSAAGAQGTGNRGLRTQGPNLDQRTESVADALFAIRNGGFSGAIMPQNIVVGKEAEEVARFVAKYAGQQAQTSPQPGETGG